MHNNNDYFDANEVNKFNTLAHEWWNLDGDFRTLHHINQARVNFICRYTSIQNKNIIDVGCGGGILAESLASGGAHVTGIDIAPSSIEIAKLHLYESGLNVNYECIDIQTKAKGFAGIFDILTCLEILEHVPNPTIIIERCFELLKPGGWAFFSSVNRNLKSYVLGIIAAEHIFKIIPKGTHEYKKLIKPSELRTMLTTQGFQIVSISGINYNPITFNTELCDNVDINYIIGCQKPC